MYTWPCQFDWLDFGSKGCIYQCSKDSLVAGAHKVSGTQMKMQVPCSFPSIKNTQEKQYSEYLVNCMKSESENLRDEQGNIQQMKESDER